MQKKLRNFITRQFGNPSGLFGKFIGNGMAKRNVYDAQWTISLLDIQPKDKWARNVDDSAMALYFGEDIASMFSKAGYRNIRLETPPAEDQAPLECILGTK